MRTSDFDFPLPKGLIAQEPAPGRDSSRLLVLRRDGTREHRLFRDLPEYLESGDILLLNRTKVFPARLRGVGEDGRQRDFLLVRELSEACWEVMCRGRYSGWLSVSEGLKARIEEGKRAVLHSSGDLREALWKYGEMPLPPYISRRAGRRDKERYQTVYAEEEGSIAAPTAGLHFTEALLERIRGMGVEVRYLTLHVGRGTFSPVRAERLGEHAMEQETFRLEASLVEEIDRRTGRLVSVGTTTTRAIEAYYSGKYTLFERPNGSIEAGTDIFIYPGYRFRAVDCLVTNFHLPRSTPLMLASAMCGLENIKGAYSEAVAMGYRFFSYGDAMLIL